MIIKNYEIAEFGEFLLELKLKGRQSRMRTRLVRLLQERLDLINEERNDLLMDYATKDEDGNIVKETDDDGEEYISLENGTEYNSEIQKLMLEEFILEETGEVKVIIDEVREIVLNTDMEFSGEEALAYDRWCDILDDSELT